MTTTESENKNAKENIMYTYIHFDEFNENENPQKYTECSVLNIVHYLFGSMARSMNKTHFNAINGKNQWSDSRQTIPNCESRGITQAWAK